MKSLALASPASRNSVRRDCSYLLAMSLILTLASATAQTDLTSEQSAQVGGMGGGSIATAGQFVSSIGTVTSAAPSGGAQFASGGVGLRNRGTGAIGISGAVTPVKAAFIYWAVITSGPAPIADKSIMVQRLSPAPASSVTTVAGTIVGTGPQPCWAGDTITVFRGSVPTSVATGNGLYKVTLLSGASGSTSGGDPFVGTPALPLVDGASIVIIGTGPSNQMVALYDSGLAGATFNGNPGISYSLILPTAATGTLTLFDNIGADGQQGSSRKALSGSGDEITKINGKLVAGPGSLYNDSDWNGSSARPLPQLWDDTGHDITVATPSGTTSLNITIANKGETHFDCLTPVANIVSFK